MYNLMQKYSLRTVLLFGVIALALGVGLGVLWPGSALKNSCHDNLIFVNPSARCGNPSSIDKAAYTSTRNDIISSIKSWKKSGKVDHVSVFLGTYITVVRLLPLRQMRVFHRPLF